MDDDQPEAPDVRRERATEDSSNMYVMLRDDVNSYPGMGSAAGLLTGFSGRFFSLLVGAAVAHERREAALFRFWLPLYIYLYKRCC